MTTDKAIEEMESVRRWFQTPGNGATIATHGARNDHEQRYGIAARSLMKAGVIYPLKYNQHR